MKIIVWKDKNATRYYDASTLEAWDVGSIEILRTLTDGPWSYMDPERAKPFISEEQRELAKIDLDSLPEAGQTHLRPAVLEARKVIEREESGYRQALEQSATALKYVKDGKSPTMIRGKGTKWERPVPASWLILEERNGYEYEDFSLEDVFSATEGNGND